MDKKEKKTPKIFKHKLLIASIAFYILVPLIFILVWKSNIPARTAGTYYCYENGALASKIVLTDNNSAKFYFYEGNFQQDKDYIYKNDVNNWSYRKSDWMDHYDKDQYKFLSTEYIRFGGKATDVYFILFKIGNKLYSDFLIDESRGGGQKCYTKK